jgi:hypothetical protein
VLTSDSGRLVKRIVAGLITLALLAAAATLVGFKIVERRIAARMQPPHMEICTEPANDLVYRTLDGGTQHLASTKGLVVFLDLWGTWCVQ